MSRLRKRIRTRSTVVLRRRRSWVRPCVTVRKVVCVCVADTCEITCHTHVSDRRFIQKGTVPVDLHRSWDYLVRWRSADYNMYSTFLTTSRGSILFGRVTLLKRKDLSSSYLRLGLIRHHVNSDMWDDMWVPTEGKRTGIGWRDRVDDLDHRLVVGG